MFNHVLNQTLTFQDIHLFTFMPRDRFCLYHYHDCTLNMKLPTKLGWAQRLITDGKGSLALSKGNNPPNSTSVINMSCLIIIVFLQKAIHLLKDWNIRITTRHFTSWYFLSRPGVQLGRYHKILIISILTQPFSEPLFPWRMWKCSAGFDYYSCVFVLVQSEVIVVCRLVITHVNTEQ